MPHLLLLNGAPGSGKSTLAALLGGRLGALVLDVDDLQTELRAGGGHDHASAKRTARAQVVDAARDHLAGGGDVVVTDYVVRSGFAEELAADAGDLDAGFLEVVLHLNAAELARRLGQDGRSADAERLIGTIRGVLVARPRSCRVDASGSIDTTLARVLDQLGPSPDAG